MQREGQCLLDTEGVWIKGQGLLDAGGVRREGQCLLDTDGVEKRAMHIGHWGACREGQSLLDIGGVERGKCLLDTGWCVEKRVVSTEPQE